MPPAARSKRTRRRARRGERWYVYVAACSDRSLYTGIAKDVDKRMALHNAGKGSKFARSRLPVRAVYREACASLSRALVREAAIKRLTRPAKLALVAS